jgi:hypothetical protein
MKDNERHDGQRYLLQFQSLAILTAASFICSTVILYFLGVMVPFVPCKQTARCDFALRPRH